jgi:hypothetical protein
LPSIILKVKHHEAMLGDGLINIISAVRPAPFSGRGICVMETDMHCVVILPPLLPILPSLYHAPVAVCLAPQVVFLLGIM